MGIISRPNNFAPNTTISSSEVNNNENTIYNEFNGNISTANLASGAVTTAKLATGAVTANELAAGSVTSAKISGIDKSLTTTDYNPYKFRAYLSGSDQTVSSSVYTKVQLNGEAFDTNSNFDSSTNYRYTAPVSGFYWISVCAKNNGNGAFAVSIYKNGSSVAEVYNSTIATGLSHGGGSDIVQLAATDYIELFVYSANTTIVNGADTTFMSGFLICRT